MGHSEDDAVQKKKKKRKKKKKEKEKKEKKKEGKKKLERKRIDRISWKFRYWFNLSSSIELDIKWKMLYFSNAPSVGVEMSTV